MLKNQIGLSIIGQYTLKGSIFVGINFRGSYFRGTYFRVFAKNCKDQFRENAQNRSCMNLYKWYIRTQKLEKILKNIEFSLKSRKNKFHETTEIARIRPPPKNKFPRKLNPPKIILQKFIALRYNI